MELHEARYWQVILSLMVDHTAFNDIHLAYRFKDTRIADIRTILHRLGHEGRLAQVPRRSALALARLAGAAMRKVSQFNSSLQTNATHLVPQLQLVAPHAASLGASVVYKDQGRRSSASILREAYSTVSTHGVHVRRDEQWRLFWVYVVDGGLRRLGEANPLIYICLDGGVHVRAPTPRTPRKGNLVSLRDFLGRTNRVC